MGEIVELRLLDLLVKIPGIRKTMHHRRHPPGKPHGFPHAGKRLLRIGVNATIRAFAVMLYQPGEKIMNVAGRKVQSLGAGRGTIWAASPTRKSRPKRIGSVTKERSGAIDFSKDGAVAKASA